MSRRVSVARYQAETRRLMVLAVALVMVLSFVLVVASAWYPALLPALELWFRYLVKPAVSLLLVLR